VGACSYLPGTVRRVRACAAPLIAACALVFAAGLPGQALADQGGGALSASQRLVLHSIAAGTRKFCAADVDPDTNLPLGNPGPSQTACGVSKVLPVAVTRASGSDLALGHDDRPCRFACCT
jgi:hypothetical protein